MVRLAADEPPPRARATVPRVGHRELELAWSCVRAEGTLTSVLDRLAARGLVVRMPHPEDRRSVVVTLTAVGRDAVAGFGATLAALEAEVLP